MSSLDNNQSFSAFKKGPSDRSFGLTMGCILLVLASWQYYKSQDFHWIILTLSFLFLILAVFFSKVLSPLNRGWMTLALILNRIMSPIFLFLVFYLIVTPMALVMRVFRPDSLRIIFDQKMTSYWHTRAPQEPKVENFKFPF